MGHFERKLRKKVSQFQKPYGVWRKEHEEKLERAVKAEEHDGAVKAKRRIPNVLWSAAAGIVLAAVILTTVILLLNNNTSQTQPGIPDLTFGEEDVAVSAMSDDELAALVAEVPQFTRFKIARGDKTTYKEDNSLVMQTIRGEYETPDDFYLITARVLYNENFVFLSRPAYDELEETRQFGDVTVNYGLITKSSDDIYLYYALSESDAGTVYWRIESYEGLFDEWLEDTFA